MVLLSRCIDSQPTLYASSVAIHAYVLRAALPEAVLGLVRESQAGI